MLSVLAARTVYEHSEVALLSVLGPVHVGTPASTMRAFRTPVIPEPAKKPVYMKRK